MEPTKRLNQKAIDDLKTKLAEFKAYGSSIDPKVIGKLMVHPEKHSSTTVKLQDLAQVVARGRHINVILSDEAHIKPVKSAIQGSDMSLTPQGPSPDQPTTLVINVPPVTGESKQAALKASSQLVEQAQLHIKTARAQKHKEIRRHHTNKTVNPDDFFKAEKKLDEITSGAKTEVEKIWDAYQKEFR